MNCPSCSVGLRKKALSNIEVDECEKCKGIWFEDDELELVESNDPETPETVLMDGTDNIENWRQRTLTDNNDTLLSNCQI